MMWKNIKKILVQGVIFVSFLGVGPAQAQNLLENSPTIDHILRPFFEVYGGYEKLAQSLGASDGIVRGFIDLRGRVYHFSEEDFDGPIRLNLVPFQIKANTDQTIRLQVALVDLAVNTAPGSQDWAGIKVSFGEVEINTAEAWGQYTKVRSTVTPAYISQGNKLNLSFSAPIEGGYQWSRVENFTHDGIESESPTDFLRYSGWYLQIRASIKLDAQLSRRSRVGGVYEVSALSIAERKIRNMGYQGETWKGYVEGKEKRYVDGRFKETLPVDQRAGFFEQMMPAQSLGLKYGYSFGQKTTREVQLVLEWVAPFQQKINIDGTLLPDPASIPEDYGKLPDPSAPNAYRGQNLEIQNPQHFRFGVRVKF